MINQAVDNAPYDKTRVGTVLERNDDNTYTIKVDGVIYYKISTMNGFKADVGDIVKVVIPTNNPSQMFISTIRYTDDTVFNGVITTNNAFIPLTYSNPDTDGHMQDGEDKDFYNALYDLGWADEVLGLPHFDIDLTYHGSWVDGGTVIDGHTVYQSNDSYNVNNAWDTAKVTFSGYDAFTLHIASYAEGTYDYVLVSTLNNDYLASCTSTSAMRSAYNNTQYTKAYTRGKQNTIEEVVFNNLDSSQEYYFYIIYQKDSSTNTSEDRGYFYIDM